jgi:hypothetical protein
MFDDVIVVIGNVFDFLHVDLYALETQGLASWDCKGQALELAGLVAMTRG